MAEFVVDASVAVLLPFSEPLTRQAEMLFTDAQVQSVRVAAPHVLPFEVTNAVRRRMRRDGLTMTQALTALDFFLRLPIDLEVDHDLHRRALRLTEAHSLGGQDAHYVALAERLRCVFWTADEKIVRAVSGRLPFVRFIGDYQSSLSTS